ncbi:MAG: bifunctional [glutamate--ammonia ligase]-adenylyl-L-tyrosine phosphorylase/[glutamate--ammonia-ligase] adenylyltransferase [Pseudomonadota bacterium]
MTSHSQLQSLYGPLGVTSASDHARSMGQFLDTLRERAPRLADALLALIDDTAGCDLWRALFASKFLRDAVVAEHEFATGLVAASFDSPIPNPVDLQKLTDELGPEAGLRRFRRQRMLSIAWRDIAGLATLDESLEALTQLADVCVSLALRVAREHMIKRYGQLLDAQGQPVSLYAICMGKLGGRELNFSSDIDIVFCYSRDGAADGRRAVAASEYCLREARRVIALLDTQTELGRVFRVDTRLRPFGESGPLAISFSALETYLQEHGRDWERYAFVKARFIGADANQDEVETFETDVIQPFVYRRYLDFGVLVALRDMQDMIAAEVARRDLGQHVKLGPGGIREVEFIAQSWQLIRGGQIASLRTRSLFAALEAIVKADCMPADTVAALGAAYRHLRVVENRLQMLSDRQTHELPDDSLQREALRMAMGVASWSELMKTLDEHRAMVTATFANLVFAGHDEQAELPSWLDLSDEALADALAQHVPGRHGDLSSVLSAFRQRLTTLPMERVARERLDTFVQRVMLLVGQFQRPDELLARVLDVAQAVLRRSAYLSLLNEQPTALDRLLRLCSDSQYLARQLAEFPMLLDELLDARLFAQPLQREALREQLDTLQQERAPQDDEARMQLLVQFARVAWFRIAVADCSGFLPIMRVSDLLSDVAQLVLQRVLAIAWQDLTRRHGAPEGATASQLGFAIIGYGKLGGIELGYGSDLDIVFLHDYPAGDTDGERSIDNTVFAARLARRIVHLLSVQTGQGHLFDVDTRLRPSGRSGLLVSSVAAFARYQADDAWTWEHQALTRARFVAGDAATGQRFTDVRSRTITECIRRDSLAEEVVRMRARMRAALSSAEPDQFDLKQDAGGIADLEFLVQYLILQHAETHAVLASCTDNIRQLDSLAACEVLAADTAIALQEIYREYRQAAHRQALNGRPAVVPEPGFVEQRRVVQRIWGAIFDGVDADIPTEH